MYDMDVGCSLSGYTASTIAKWHYEHTLIDVGSQPIFPGIVDIIVDVELLFLGIGSCRGCHAGFVTMVTWECRRQSTGIQSDGMPLGTMVGCWKNLLSNPMDLILIVC